MQSTADIVIIGAGVIGCSTAYHLARQGLGDIVLLDQAQVGSGVSSKSAAMFSVQFCTDALTVQMAKQAQQAYAQFEEEMGAPTDFHKSGWLYLATEESAPALRRQAALLQAHDVPTEILSPDEIAARYPQINCADIALGTFGPDDGPFDPHMIMSGFLRRARQLGVRLHEDTRVREIVVANNRVSAVVTNRGAIATRTVVNAAGPWAGDVARMAGLSIPLLNSARTIVVTNPVAAIPAHYPFVEELGIEWYFRPELDGVLMGMGARRVERPEVPLDGEQVDAIVEHAVHRVPALAQASLLTAWTGVRPLSPDGRPFVGAHPRVSGYIFNCGWGGVGFIMAPLAGRMVTGLLTGGGMYTIDGHPLRADRFDRP